MAYPMRYSGFEWIGNIPAHWGITDIGNVFVERSEKVNDDDYPPLSVTMNGVIPQMASVVKSDDRSNRKLVCAGDFVINSRSDRRGAYGVAPFDGSCSVINIVLQPRDPDDAAYFHYVLHTSLFPDEFYRWGNGIVADLWTTRWSSMKKIHMPLPPREERKRIAAYLDEQSKEIDLVIERTKDSIIRYRKMKQAIITNAITKGIQNSAELKDSGYAWYGEIPIGWKTKKLKRIFSIKKDIAGQEGYTVLSITQRGIIPKDISRNEGQMASDYSNYQLVSVGDFAMNHMDLLTGWVDISNYSGVTSPDYRVFTINDASTSNPEFYLYLLQMCYFNHIFYSLGQGVSEFGRWRLQADKFLEFDVLVPPYEEQCEIAEYLRQKVSEIDKIVAKKEQLIEKLVTYKKTMIYEFATGKKEVPTEQTVAVSVVYPYFPAALSTDKRRFAQAILMCRILDKCRKKMGRVKLEKMLYTIESSIGFDLETEYVREAAGPLDASIYECERIISKRNKWYTLKSSSYGVSYAPTKDSGKYEKYYDKYFASYDAEIDRIINIFMNYDADQAEIVATLFAAWNDFIIDQRQFSDEELVDEVLNNWNDSKKRFSRDVWLRAIDQMRKNNIIPSGYGKRTVVKN